MRVETTTRDHVLVVQAALARRNDMPLYAEQLLCECDDPLRAAVDIVGLLMQERIDAGADDVALPELGDE